MKLVAQIVAGILIASLIGWGVFFTFLYYTAQEIEEENRIIAHERSIRWAKERALFQKKLEAKKRKATADRKAKEQQAKIEWVNKNAYVNSSTDSSRLAREKYIQNSNSSNNNSVYSSRPARIQPSEQDEANNVLILQKLIEKQNN